MSFGWNGVVPVHAQHSDKHTTSGSVSSSTQASIAAGSALDGVLLLDLHCTTAVILMMIINRTWIVSVISSLILLLKHTQKGGLLLSGRLSDEFATSGIASK